MKRKLLYGAGGLALLVAAFLGGRFSAPVKVVEKEKTVEVKVRDEQAITNAVAAARAQWAKEIQDHTVIRTRYVEGKPVERIVYVDRDTKATGSSESAAATKTETTAHEETAKTIEKEKVTEYGRPGWRVSAMGAWDPGRPLGTPDLLGLEAQRRLFWTLWAGPVVFHVADRTYLGLSLALEW